MALVGLPCPAVTVERLGSNFGLAGGADQFPGTRCIRNNAVQRTACQLTAFTGFNARSGWLGHSLLSSQPEIVQRGGGFEGAFYFVQFSILSLDRLRSQLRCW